MTTKGAIINAENIDLFENRTFFQTDEGNSEKKKKKKVTVEIGSLYRKEMHFLGSYYCNYYFTVTLVLK